MADIEAATVAAYRAIYGEGMNPLEHPEGVEFAEGVATAVAATLVTDEIARLMHVIDRDRYVVAYCLGAIETAVHGRVWLLEGRGPYEWDDDRYRDEFGDAVRAIREASQPLKIVAWDKSDCTRIEERVNAAKLAAHELLANPGAPREMIATELWGVMNGWPTGAEFKVGDRVQKKGKASWRGKVVGWYRTELTELGYAVESAFEPGSVQIYPATALVAWDDRS